MRGAEEIQRPDSNGSDIDEAEESGYMNGLIYDKVYKVAEKFAGTCIGQYVTHKMDRVLKLIEDTAKWSLPPRNKDINESSKPLERPLPWIPFIALILMLRLVRVGLSIAGLFIGNAPLIPRDIVCFIQTRRKKLQSMRIAGMKEIQKIEQEKRNAQKRSLFSRLTSMMSIVICRPQLYEDILVSEKYSGRAECSGVQTCQKNRESSKILCDGDDDDDDDDDVHDNDENNPAHELTLMQVLDQYYTSSNEEDDPDYIPPTDAMLDEDTSTGSSDEYTSNQEDGEDGQDTDIKQPVSTVINKKTNSYMTNGNSSIESDADDLILGSNANGEYLGENLENHAIPKPIKLEPIEQEGFVNNEEKNSRDYELSDAQNSSNVTDLQQEHNSSKMSNNIHSHHHQQSVENETNFKGSICNAISENGIDQHVDGMNGIEETSESGSPDSFGTHGFPSTSILEDPKAVNPGKREEAEPFFENENFIRAESSNKSRVVPKQTKSTSHSGKQIKNKFRGKRR